MTTAMRHPYALFLLIASASLAGAMQFLPWLRFASDFAWWVLLLGGVSYAASILVLLRWEAPPKEPELRLLHTIRREIQSKLKDRQAAIGDAPSELSRVLADAIDRLDQEIEPGLRELLIKEQDSIDNLTRYEAGQLPLPSPAINERQRRAIEECVQQASDALGTLTVLLLEGNDREVADRARSWAEDLTGIHQILVTVLTTEQPPTAPAEPDPAAASLEFRHQVDLGLKQLKNQANLSQCEPIQLIPATLRVTHSLLNQNGNQMEATPLQQAQALGEVLVAAIDRLSPPNDSTGKAAETRSQQFRILHDEYVLGRSTRTIRDRLHLSEANFYLKRREAVAAVARDLAAQEEQLARNGEANLPE